MKRKLKREYKMTGLHFLIALCGAVIFSSCKNSTEVPLPEEFTAYPQPEVKPLVLSEPRPLHWDTISHTIPKPTVFHLDLNQLPSKPFDPTGFKPLDESPKETEFDFSALESRPFDLKKIPEHKLSVKITKLAPPRIIKLTKPKQVPSSVMDIKEWQQFSDGAMVIYGMAKDTIGRVWMATIDGIFSFDGNELAHYLSGSIIRGIGFDKAGNLWAIDITNRKGRSLLRINFTDKTVDTAPLDSIYVERIMHKLRLTKSNQMWITAPGYVPVVLDPISLSYRLLDSAAGFNSSRYFSHDIDDDNRAWLSSRNGIEVIDQKENKIYHIRRKDGLGMDTVTDILSVGKDTIWAALLNGVDCINLRAGTILHYKIQTEGIFNVWALLQDKTGLLWIGADDGVYILNPRNNTLRVGGESDGLNVSRSTQLLEDRHGKIIFSSNSSSWTGAVYTIRQNGKTVFPLNNSITNIASTVEDATGNLWIGTEKDLFIVDSARKRYRTLDVSHGLANESIEVVFQDKGKIIIGTDYGYNIYDPQKHQLLRVGKNEGPDSIRVNSMLTDNQGNNWIAAIMGGIRKYEGKSQLTLRLNEKGGLNGDEARSADLLPDGRIVTTTYENGPAIIDPVKNTIRTIANIPEFLSSNAYYANYIDSKGRIWVIMSKKDLGLFMIDPEWKTVTRFTARNGLESNRIASVLEYKGKILVNASEKINILTPPELTPDNKWQAAILLHSDGLKRIYDSYISDAVTKRGNYIYGDAGLAIVYGIHPDTSQSVVYVKGMAVMGKGMDFSAYAKHTIADTSQSENTNKPTLLRYVTNDKIKWDSTEGPFSLAAGLSLPYDKNSIQFTYGEVNSGRPDEAEYAYVLEGIDKGWTFTNNTHTETYLNLSPGNYTFKVSSRWVSGRWSAPAVYSFVIRPPWYATWWAYLIYFLIAASLLRLYIIIRSRKLKRENRLLEEKVNLRTQQLKKSIDDLKSTQSQLIQSEKMASLGELTAGIAHEIQNPLNFVNNFSEVSNELIDEMNEELNKGEIEEAKAIANDIKQNLEKINHHGKRADAIVKGMLQHSRSSTGQKEMTDINALCDEYLRLAYHGLRAKDKSFNAKFETDFDASLPKINVVPQEMGRVILNLITNAFYAVGKRSKDEGADRSTGTVNEKRKSAGEDYHPSVTLKTQRLEKQVKITVRDNGNGIPQRVIDKIFQPFFTTKPAGEGTGLGLSLSYDIVKAHGGEISVDTKEGQFTEFSILLPL